MKYILLILFCLIPSILFAESYRIMNDGRIQRQSDLASIPPTEKNKDYIKYLKDKKEGAEVLPFDYEKELVRVQSAELAKAELEIKQKVEKEKEILIQMKIKEQAIAELQAEGKL